jgi:hypothetical protein
VILIYTLRECHNVVALFFQAKTKKFNLKGEVSMKKINLLTIVTLVAVMAVFAFSATFAVAGGAGKKVPGVQHRLLFPEGHDIPATGCHYDDEEDVYFCPYEVPVKVDKNIKMMHKGGEPVFRMVPKAKHKAHDTGLPCSYDEEEAVYLCSYAE